MKSYPPKSSYGHSWLTLRLDETRSYPAHVSYHAHAYRSCRLVCLFSKLGRSSLSYTVCLLCKPHMHLLFSPQHHFCERADTVIATLDVDYDIKLLPNTNNRLHAEVVQFDSNEASYELLLCQYNAFLDRTIGSLNLKDAFLLVEKCGGVLITWKFEE